ncbi:hypothetical protein LCGC14_2209580 [marine sediment metagenome]|uniref:Uncharacterized protein n=1 Tax=marine sediment metagenome TaxID=412755 RepID=A0A0F9DED4_9ZZZZ
MKIKTYEVFDHKGLLLNSEKEGEKYKYLVRHVNLKTGEETRHNREAMFLNHFCFRACLDRWNRESEKRKSTHRWIYSPAKL